MGYGAGIIFSDTAVTSASGASGVVSTNGHTKCIHFYNTHATTNATVKLNGGPHQVVIPAINSGGGYVEIEGMLMYVYSNWNGARRFFYIDKCISPHLSGLKLPPPKWEEWPLRPLHQRKYLV